MSPTRREFVGTSLAAAGALALPGSLHGSTVSSTSPESAVSEVLTAPKPLRVLFLGGTGFIGPHQVRHAMYRGHTVTLFNRGRTNPGLFPGVETLIGDQPLRPFLILALSPDVYEYFPSEQVRLLMPFIIHAVNDSDPTDDDSMLRTYHRLCADVEQAIAADTTRNALATDTRILEREMHELEGQRVWALVKGEIREHRTYGEPNGDG